MALAVEMMMKMIITEEMNAVHVLWADVAEIDVVHVRGVLM